MLKKEYKYVDYDGNERTETLYFNMTKAEIAAMQVKMDGKYIDYLKDLIAGNHIEKLFDVFKSLVLDSYGEKSADGRRFIKSSEIRADFEASIPFSDILVDLITDANKMSAFTRAILPPDMVMSGGEVDVKNLPPIS